MLYHASQSVSWLRKVVFRCSASFFVGNYVLYNYCLCQAGAILYWNNPDNPSPIKS